MKESSNKNHNCPVCKTELKTQFGNQLHPDDDKFGITMYCPNKQCTAQEVAGHANKIEDAYQVILDKFPKRK